jgi:hypothetical protein
MKAENPFADWLSTQPYRSGVWVPVAAYHGWASPSQLPVLFPAGHDAAVLDTPVDWPFRHNNGAMPTVRRSGGDITDLAPSHTFERSRTPAVALTVLQRPPVGPVWLEPVQTFLLFHGATPKRDQNGGRVWLNGDHDGLSVPIANWVPDAQGGKLVIRRLELLDFLWQFGVDLALFYMEDRDTPQLPAGWRDDERAADRAFKAWSSPGLSGEKRSRLTCVTIVRRPQVPSAARDENCSPSKFPYVVGVDPNTGQDVTVTHDTAEFLSPVFFRPEVLSRYRDNPDHFSVTDNSVAAQGHWQLDISQTRTGLIQAWLGDVARLPESVQAHWVQYSTAADDGVPEWRLKRDLCESPDDAFADAEGDEVTELRAALTAANQAALTAFGVALYQDASPEDQGRIDALHRPLNESYAAFQSELQVLALLCVEHLNPAFLKAVNAPDEENGTLNRLASWLARHTGNERRVVADALGGLYTVQGLRSSVVAHRTGTRGRKGIADAGIDPADLPAGFIRLVGNATASIEALTAYLAS